VSRPATRERPPALSKIGYLRKIMREQGVSELVLAEFAKTELGFDTPKAGLEELNKQQASALIDALTKQVAPIETGPVLEDPWQTAPLFDLETGETAS
jgi:hypothetical protein